MASTADQIRAEIAALEESSEDMDQRLWAEIRKVQERLTIVEGQLRGRAKNANEVVMQVFASGAYEATLNRMAAMERGQVSMRRQLLEIEEKLREAEPEVNEDVDLDFLGD